MYSTVIIDLLLNWPSEPGPDPDPYLIKVGPLFRIHNTGPNFCIHCSGEIIEAAQGQPSHPHSEEGAGGAADGQRRGKDDIYNRPSQGHSQVQNKYPRE
jgi:hypothetical protein